MIGNKRGISVHLLRSRPGLWLWHTGPLIQDASFLRHTFTRFLLSAWRQGDGLRSDGVKAARRSL